MANSNSLPVHGCFFLVSHYNFTTDEPATALFNNLQNCSGLLADGFDNLNLLEELHLSQYWKDHFHLLHTVSLSEGLTVTSAVVSEET